MKEQASCVTHGLAAVGWGWQRNEPRVQDACGQLPDGLLVTLEMHAFSVCL